MAVHLQGCQRQTYSQQKRAALSAAVFLQIKFSGANAACPLFHSVFTFKTLYPSTGVHKFLFSCKEGMAVRANINSQVLFGRTCCKAVTTGTSHGSLLVIGMYLCLHGVHLFPLKIHVYYINIRCPSVQDFCRKYCKRVLTCRQIFQRVLIAAVFQQFEMNMGACGIAGLSHGGNLLSAAYLLTGLHIKLGTVPVH